MDRIVIFCDYGLDDAAATVSILDRSDRFEAITLIPVGGNVPVEVSYRNCHTLLSYYPRLCHKIQVVNTCHISQPETYLAEIHGNDGMGDILSPLSDKVDVAEVPFEAWLEGYAGGELLLSLGPATLVKRVLEKAAPKQLVLMGGVVHSEPNYGDYEFNHALDVSAFDACLRYPHTAITLDTCRTEVLDMRRYEIPGEDLHGRILRADQALSITRGEEGCFVWDDVAACYVLHPERFAVKGETDPHGNRIFNAAYISDKLYFED